MNLILAIYLQELTKEGNGCVWYLMNYLLDSIFGLLIAYVLFRILDYIAVKNDIEILKSGVYMDEKVDLVDKDRKDTDKQINYRIWIVQMCIWTMIVFLSKIIIFFFEVMYHKPIIKLGNFLLSGL